MIRKRKGIGKRLTAFLMTFIMVTSLTVGIAPMETKAATKVYENCTLNVTSATTIEDDSYVKSDVLITNNFKDNMTLDCGGTSYKKIKKGFLIF